jgi:hypothetical protein
MPKAQETYNFAVRQCVISDNVGGYHVSEFHTKIQLDPYRDDFRTQQGIHGGGSVYNGIKVICKIIKA